MVTQKKECCIFRAFLYPPIKGNENDNLPTTYRHRHVSSSPSSPVPPKMTLYRISLHRTVVNSEHSMTKENHSTNPKKWSMYLFSPNFNFSSFLPSMSVTNRFKPIKVSMQSHNLKFDCSRPRRIAWAPRHVTPQATRT